MRNIIVVFGICCWAVSSVAQTEGHAKIKKHKFALYAGIGPNYYFNNLIIGKDLVNEFNYSFAAKLMWEPEHLLSVGIESGYYRLYTLHTSGRDSAHIANSAIPIQLVVSMKFLKRFYFDFSMGQSRLINKVNSESNGNFETKAWSFADFSGTVGYRYRFQSRISIGAELKYFYSTGFIDRNIALLCMVGYNF